MVFAFMVPVNIFIIVSSALFQKWTVLKRMFIGLNGVRIVNIELVWLHLPVVVLCPLLSAGDFGEQFRCVTCIPGGCCCHGNTLTVGHMLLSWNFIGCVTKINECCFKRWGKIVSPVGGMNSFFNYGSGYRFFFLSSFMNSTMWMDFSCLYFNPYLKDFSCVGLKGSLIFLCTRIFMLIKYPSV